MLGGGACLAVDTCTKNIVTGHFDLVSGDTYNV